MKSVVLIFFSLIVAFVGFTQNQRPPINPELQTLLNQKDSALLRESLIELEASDKEKDLLLAIEYYESIKDFEKKATLEDRLLTKFPSGVGVFNLLTIRLVYEKDGYENEKNYQELVKRFGSIPAFKEKLRLDGRRFNVARSFAASDPQKSIEWIHKVQDSSLYKMYLWGLSNELIIAGNAADAEILINEALTKIKKGEYYTVTNYQETMRSGASVFLAAKKYEAAYNCIKPIYTDSAKKSDSRLYKVYQEIMVGIKQYKEVFPWMEEQMKTGNASNLTKERLKEAYLVVKGTSSGYDRYYEGLLVELRKNIKAHLPAVMRNLPATDFSLKTPDGKTVTLESLKGKIIVIDFWATWCAPCKALFPKMQKLMDRYKNREDIVFLFIHTMENSAKPTEEASKYLRERNFKFTLLMDLKDKTTKKNPVAENFKVRAIPAKFVIDKQGIIRFNTVGNTGGDDSFLEEMSAMIELVQTE